MGFLSDRPLFTEEHESVLSFTPEEGTTYLYGVTTEPRSAFGAQLAQRVSGVKFVEIREIEAFAFETDIDGFDRVNVRNRDRLEMFVRSVSGAMLYLDITGLSHSTWAPIVRVCVESGVAVRAIYLEPSTYTLNRTRLDGEIYDLSERIDGVEPIPLFATLDDPSDDAVCFVPLLGFEGVRFAHMMEVVQPHANKIFPVIGVPGFQPQFPFEAYLGNAGVFERYGAARFIRFARANCPFSLFYSLEDLASRYPRDKLKIGLIGTKPHALGAILYAIRYPDRVEIVYDHVKRKAGRTAGTERCLVYAISEFYPYS